MSTFLHVADSVHSPDMRHEVSEAVPDAVIFIEHEDRRYVACGSFELEAFAGNDELEEVLSFEELGLHQILKDPSWPATLRLPELTLRALRRVGATKAVTPAKFPLLHADYLRDKGVDIEVDADAWSARRRRKKSWQIEGIRRAQVAADAAMHVAARILSQARKESAGELRTGDDVLTAELLSEAMDRELLTRGVSSDRILIQSGDAWSAIHDPGSGPILADRSCIVDLAPRDLATGMMTDLTRTFVPGKASDELRRLHGHVRKALDVALETIKPGNKDVYHQVAGYFHNEGFPTPAHDGYGTKEGFITALGHGVGLEVHEEPILGPRPQELIAGDVIAIEPGLYFKGIGGVRLEDTVLITEEGAQYLTDPLPYDLEP